VFNNFHDDFAEQWQAGIAQWSGCIPRFPHMCVGICNFLYLLKRIRFRFIAGFSFDSPEECIDFSISRIPEGSFLSPAVFINSHESKIYDALPLQLSSLQTRTYILTHQLIGETMMVLWFLLVMAWRSPEFQLGHDLMCLKSDFGYRLVDKSLRQLNLKVKSWRPLK
jgi:hypothetical protein